MSEEKARQVCRDFYNPARIDKSAISLYPIGSIIMEVSLYALTTFSRPLGR